MYQNKYAQILFIPHMPESKLCGKNRKKSSDRSFCKYFQSVNLQLKAERWNLFLPFVVNVILNLTLTRLNYRRSRISYTSESVRLFLLFVCQTHLCVLLLKFSRTEILLLFSQDSTLGRNPFTRLYFAAVTEPVKS